MKCFQSPARSVLRLAAADSFVLLNLTKFLFVGTLKLWFRVFTSLRLNTRLSWRRMCWISEIWNKCFCEQQKLAKLFGNQQLRTSNTNETHCEGRSTQMHIPVFNVCYVCVAKRFGSVYAQNGDPNLICKKVFCFSQKWSTSTSWFGLWKWPTKKQFLRMNLALNPWGVSVDLPSHVSFPQNHISRQIWADWREPRGFSGS